MTTARKKTWWLAVAVILLVALGLSRVAPALVRLFGDG